MGQENFPNEILELGYRSNLSRLGDYNGLNFVSDLYQIFSTTNLNNS